MSNISNFNYYKTYKKPRKPRVIVAFLLLWTLFCLGCSNLPLLKHEIGVSSALSKFRFSEFYAFNIELYVVTEGTLKVPTGTAATDEEALRKLFTGWSSTSANTILAQAGIWIKEMEIKYVNSGSETAGGGEFGDLVREKIAADGSSHKDFVVGTNGQALGFELADGGSHTAPAGKQRIILGIYPPGSGGSSWATLGKPNVFFQHDHGRNLMAHELGHNFALEHPSSGGCESGNTNGRVMNGTVFPDDYNYANCEIKIARKTMKLFVQEYPDAVRVERPAGEDLKKAIGFFEGKDFASTNHGFSASPDVIASATGLRAAAGYSAEDAERFASPARAYRCALHDEHEKDDD